MEKPSFAGVSVFDVPFTLDKIYSYEIPEDLKGLVHRGDIVTVPFGNGSRKRYAVVRELSDCCEYSAPLKSILSVQNPLFRLNDELLGLCGFLAEHCFCAFCDVVRCILPPAALGNIREYYIPAAPLPQNADAEEIASLLKKHKGKLPAKNLRTPLLKLAETLVSEGILKKEWELPEKNGSFVEYLFLVPTEKELQCLLGAEGNGKIRSAAKREILQTLRDRCNMKTDRALLLQILAERGFPSAGTALRQLRDAGIVKAERVDCYQNSYEKKSDAPNTFGALSEAQKKAYRRLCDVYETGAAAALLYGITGSGKTTVIKALMDRVLSDGRSVILLVPEISLTPQLTSLFCACYGSRIAVIHSALSQKERFDTYKRIALGHADIVIGTRSAVFAPIQNLGLIILDEEGEHSYRSEMTPKYHARDAARYRCAKNHAMLLLSSATPSFESYYKAKKGIYTLVELPSRFGAAKLPKVLFSDLRRELKQGNMSPLGKELHAAIANRLNLGEQIILFINRRGYNHFVTCLECGCVIQCPHCSVSMTYHKSEFGSPDYMECHFCGYRMPSPTECPSCGSRLLNFFGFGTQRIREELAQAFPNARILRMDTDSVRAAGSYEEVIDVFKRGEADILLGTQMVTKGHDFPNVTLVGVVDADSLLYMDDYRAAERCFSLITQVIGRAGRAEKEGLAILQTTDPDNEVLHDAASQNYPAFFEKELTLRRSLLFPPFCDIVELGFIDSKEEKAQAAAAHAFETVRVLRENSFSDVPMQVYGPFSSGVYKIKDKYHMRILFKIRQNKRAREFFREVITALETDAEKLTVDVNPERI